MVATFRALEEGRYASSRTLSAGCDGRALRQLTSDARADGKGVWSCPPDAGVKFAVDDPQMTVATKPGSPGRARYKP